MRALYSILKCLLLIFLLINGSLGTNLQVETQMQAVWDRPPFIVEIIETIAGDNSEKYFSFITKLYENILDLGIESLNKISAKKLYDISIETANELECFIDDSQRSIFDLELYLHNSVPKIQSYYEIYNNNNNNNNNKNHDNIDHPILMVYNNEYLYKIDDLYALKSKSKIIIPDLYPNDHIYQKSISAPYLILYADLLSSDFPQLHSLLMEFANEGKISYVLRYKPSPSFKSKKLFLSGYHAQLALKRTDYLVIDDRDHKENIESQLEESSIDENEENNKNKNNKKINKKNNKKINKKIDKESFADIIASDSIPEYKKPSSSGINTIDYKAAMFISQSKNPLGSLVNVTKNFPSYASYLANLNINPFDKAFVKEVELNSANGLNLGSNQLFVNGRYLNLYGDSIFNVLEVIKSENKLLNQFKQLNFEPKSALCIYTNADFILSKKDLVTLKYDVRDNIENNSAIYYLNDIETDSRYRNWKSSVKKYFESTGFDMVPPAVKRNTFNLIVPIDFASMDSLVLVERYFLRMIYQSVPVRIGLVPVFDSKHSIEQAKIFIYFLKTFGLKSALEYFRLSFDNKFEPSEKIFNRVEKNYSTKKDKKKIPFSDIPNHFDEEINSAKHWSERLSINPSEKPVFINGYKLTANNDQWIMNVFSTLKKEVELLQKLIKNDKVTDNTKDIYSVLLEGSTPSVNRYLSGNLNSRNFKNTFEFYNNINSDNNKISGDLPSVVFTGNDDTVSSEIILAVDFDTKYGLNTLKSVLTFFTNLDKEKYKTIKVSLVNVHDPSSNKKPSFSNLITKLTLETGKSLDENLLSTVLSELEKEDNEDGNDENNSQWGYKNWDASDQMISEAYWNEIDLVIGSSLGMKKSSFIMMDGHKIDFPFNITFSAEDLQTFFNNELMSNTLPVIPIAKKIGIDLANYNSTVFSKLISLFSYSYYALQKNDILINDSPRHEEVNYWSIGNSSGFIAGTTNNREDAYYRIDATIDPVSETAQRYSEILNVLSKIPNLFIQVTFGPTKLENELPVKRYFRSSISNKVEFDKNGEIVEPKICFEDVEKGTLFTLDMITPPSWIVRASNSDTDLDNIIINKPSENVYATYELKNILIEGHAKDFNKPEPPRGLELILKDSNNREIDDTIVMANLGYFQFKAYPGKFSIDFKYKIFNDVFNIKGCSTVEFEENLDKSSCESIYITSFTGQRIFYSLERTPNYLKSELIDIETNEETQNNEGIDLVEQTKSKMKSWFGNGDGNAISKKGSKTQAEINIFSVASGHLYERFLSIMILSVMKNTDTTVKFWFIENFLSPSFIKFIPFLADKYKFDYEFITYKWPQWLRQQKEKQRIIWGYKILFLDVLFPLDLNKVIFVDADQVVRTNMKELVDLDLKGAPYGYTPMCDSRKEMEGFRFWKTGYWKTALGRKLKYHISALYVIDLKKFRKIAAGDKLRSQYQQLSADPNSLSNLDQDLPNSMQRSIPIYSLPQDWLWCETWCSDEALKTAKTIDLCNNPLTKEPKLDRARRQLPEWVSYDNEVSDCRKEFEGVSQVHDEL